jgi:hypothetical protein
MLQNTVLAGALKYHPDDIRIIAVFENPCIGDDRWKQVRWLEYGVANSLVIFSHSVLFAAFLCSIGLRSSGG